MRQVMYRQGDVLLTARRKPARIGTPIAPEAGRVVLAHGEATGHAHALDATHAAYYATADQRTLRVLRGGRLLHEEHAPIVVPAGWYDVRRQREYTPGEIRTVAD